MSSFDYTKTPCEAKARIWRCGDQTRCPKIPKPDGNPWDTCLEPLIEKDRQQCEAWKDEIQNLLIFSGLFSAVVTAFVVQTYEDLQPNPPHAALLVARLVQLQSNSNDTLQEIIASLNSDSSPSSSEIRTNIFWFSSLVLSLIVVLIGTVSLQWLREFQRYPPSLSPKKVFAARNLRAESFERWYAPQIIAGLPQLLQLAVILFFAGLMDALLQLNQLVALPVIVLGGCAMCFQAVTTILPTLQSFWLINKAEFSKPPLHSPYKSPQSWAFLRLATSTLVRTCLNWIGCMMVQALILPAAPIVMFFQITGTDSLLWKFVDRLAVSLHLQYLGTINNWDEFDDLWLEERHRSATGSRQESHNYFHRGTRGTDYDAARGIARIMSSRAVGEPMALAIYHCFQKLDPSVITDDLLRLMGRRLPPWLFAREGLRKGRYLNPPSTLMIKEENEMFLLSRFPQTIRVGIPLHAFRLRQLELFVQITAHIFVDRAWDEAALHCDSLSVCPNIGKGFDSGPLFVPPLLQDVKAMRSVPHDFALEVVEQLVKIFQAYITSVLRDESETTEAHLSIAEAEPVLAGFMDVVHVASLFLAFDTNPKCQNLVLVTDLAFILDQIAARLTNALARSIPASRLHRCGKLYASRFHFTDWVPLQKRAPVFAHSFKALVRAISLYSAEQRDYDLVYLPVQFTTQWKELREEVLQVRPTSQRFNTAETCQRRSPNDAHNSTEGCSIEADIGESMYPSSEGPPYMSHISSNRWIEGNTSLRSDAYHDVCVGISAKPSPASSTVTTNHFIPSGGRCCTTSVITDHTDSRASSTLNDSPRSLDLVLHSHLEGQTSTYCHHNKTYEIV